jgi:hypothetical protein
VPAYSDPARQTVAHLLALPLAPVESWARPDGTVPKRPAPAGGLAYLSY